MDNDYQYLSETVFTFLFIKVLRPSKTYVGILDFLFLIIS